MEWLEKLVDMITGGLPSAAASLCPEHVKRQWLARLADHNPFATIAANHDLVRATRLAWIEAALEILDEGHGRAFDREWRGSAADIERFHVEAREVLLDTRDLAFDRRKEPGTSPIDAHVDVVINGVPELVASGRGPDLGRSVTGGFAAVLAEMSGWPAEKVPQVYQSLADRGLPTPGGGQCRTFGELVFAAFAEIIKDPKAYPQAREAFYIAMDDLARDLGRETLAAVHGLDARFDAVTSRLDLLSAMRDGATAYLVLLPGIAEAVGEMRWDVKEVRADLKEVLVFVRQAGLFQRAADEGISEAAVRAIVERLGGQGIGRDDLIPFLENWIEAARAALGRYSNEGEAFEAARQEAERRFRQGRLREASGAFMDEFAREEKHESERQEERKRQRLRLLEEAIRYDELAFDGEAAAVKLRKMAEVEGFLGANAIGLRLSNKAAEFQERGEREGSNAALLVAIATSQAVLREWTRERVPDAWAMAQRRYGSALAALGARESESARLEKSEAAYLTALEVWTRERDPIVWADLQIEFGSVLGTLGARESGTTRLEKAVSVFRNGLKEQSREKSPYNWAMAHNNLGNALRTLGERESGTASLEEAVIALRTALEEFTRERNPHEWAMTQFNLGNTLGALGERDGDTARLKEAVEAYRLSLEECTRDRFPFDWAITQCNLSGILWKLGDREVGTTWLTEAITASCEAIKELSPDRVPLDWARAHNNLGNALTSLAAQEDRMVPLKKALVAFRKALTQRPRERVPLQWAETQNNLGNVFSLLGGRRSGTAYLEDAVAAYRAALEERTRERVPLDWATSYGNQAIAMGLIAERLSDPDLARRALAQIQTAREVFDQAGHAPYAAIYTKQAERLEAMIGRLAAR